ncbi:MAG: type II secretion system F family protein [Leptospiraceae bacterium]|nr:type II secretion system F family protein [Leptospiraceae bacterium]MDW7975732.1 type II secretion system F family protein [Leptospiraceae bacterium]
MPVYKYTAIDKKGKQVKGILDAQNVAHARKLLRNQNLYVKTLNEDIEKRERELFPFLAKILYRVPRKDVAIFARELGTLLDAGIPLDKSLTNIIEQTENIYLKKAIIQIKTDILEGDSLSKAISKHNQIFPEIYPNLIQVGEQTGNYEKSLLRLADLEEASLKLRNKVTTAMFYPLIMLLFLGGIMIFLLSVVIPQIQEMFVQLNMELPLITKIVIGVSNLFFSYRILFVFLFLGLVVFGFFRWYRTEKGREKTETFLLKVPLLGSIIRKVIIARFTRNLGVLLENRVSLLVSLQIISKLVNHKIFEKEILNAIEKIKEGAKISEAFSDSKILTFMVKGMISAGESTDTLAHMLLKTAEITEDEIDATIQRFSTLIEPAMIVIMGLLIGVIMSAILLPIYNLTRYIEM